MIEIFTLIGVFSILLFTTLHKKEPKQEHNNNDYSNLMKQLNNIEKNLSDNEELIRGNRFEAIKDTQKQNKKIDAYTTAMNRLILLYEELSNNPKPTKKTETESEKVEMITDKLFEELEELSEKKLDTISNNKTFVKTI